MEELYCSWYVWKLIVNYKKRRQRLNLCVHIEPAATAVLISWVESRQQLGSMGRNLFAVNLKLHLLKCLSSVQYYCNIFSHLYLSVCSCVLEVRRLSEILLVFWNKYCWQNMWNATIQRRLQRFKVDSKFNHDLNMLGKVSTVQKLYHWTSKYWTYHKFMSHFRKLHKCTQNDT